jgi:hypothetical protein
MTVATRQLRFTANRMIAARTERGRDSEVLSSALVIFQTSVCFFPNAILFSFLQQKNDMEQNASHCLHTSAPGHHVATFVKYNSRHLLGIATGYGLDGRGVGVRVSVGTRIFTSPRRLDWLWGSPTLLSNGGFSLGVKRPGREADRSPPTSAEVKKTWVHTSTPPYVFMA